MPDLVPCLNLRTMKKGTVLLSLLLAGGAATLLCAGRASAQQKKDYPIQPVTFTSVKLTDNFWEPKILVNAKVTIPYILDKCKKTGRVDNFRRASGKKGGDFQGIYFNDSDIYKWMEAASWSPGAQSRGERLPSSRC